MWLPWIFITQKPFSWSAEKYEEWKTLEKVLITSHALDPYFMLLLDFLIGLGDKLNSFHFHRIIVSLYHHRPEPVWSAVPSFLIGCNSAHLKLILAYRDHLTVQTASTPLFGQQLLFSQLLLLEFLVIQEVGSERQACEKFSIASHRLVADLLLAPTSAFVQTSLELSFWQSVTGCSCSTTAAGWGRRWSSSRLRRIPVN